MVHALKKTHSLLRPGGLLIDLHDSTQRPQLVGHAGGQPTPIGEVLDDSGFLRLRQTDEAIAKVIGEGLFVTDAEETFDYETHIETLEDFHTWLDDAWDTSYLDNATLRRVIDLLIDADDSRLIIHRTARMTRLKAI
jgi:hypothetical protein